MGDRLDSGHFFALEVEVVLSPIGQFEVNGVAKLGRFTVLRFETRLACLVPTNLADFFSGSCLANGDQTDEFKFLFNFDFEIRLAEVIDVVKDVRESLDIVDGFFLELGKDVGKTASHSAFVFDVKHDDGKYREELG